MVHKEAFEQKSRSGSFDTPANEPEKPRASIKTSPAIRQRMESFQVKEKSPEEVNEVKTKKELRLADLAGTASVRTRTEAVSPSIEKSFKTKQAEDDAGNRRRERSVSESDPAAPLKRQKGQRRDPKSPTAKKIQGE